MSWKWEEMTSGEFAEAVEGTGGVGMVACGVIEKHGSHLPLGTDSMCGMALAEAAAALEPVVIFPFYYFGMIHTARPQPGTIAYSTRLLLDMLDETCGEMARNGLKKIVLLDSHGGNVHLLGLFMRMQMEAPRDYVVYLLSLGASGCGDPSLTADLMTTPYDMHGGEIETSDVLAHHPELVKMDRVGESSGSDLQRLAHLGPVGTSVDWYARFPEHYAGDAVPASAEKGTVYLNRRAERVAKHLKAIKADTKTPELLREFYARSQH